MSYHLPSYCGEVLSQNTKMQKRHIVNSVAEVKVFLQWTKEGQFFKRISSSGKRRYVIYKDNSFRKRLPWKVLKFRTICRQCLAKIYRDPPSSHFTSDNQFRQWIVDNLTIISSWFLWKFKGRINCQLRFWAPIIQLFHSGAHKYSMTWVISS